MGIGDGHILVLKMQSANNFRSIMTTMNDIWQYRNYLLSRFFQSLSILMLLYELLILIKSFDNIISTHRICTVIIIISICLLYALYGLLRPPKSITLEINKRTQLTIKEGNLMEATGVKVIPVNEYFDTHLGDGIINKDSLHGQFLSMFQGRISELRVEIDKQLESFQPLPKNRERTKDFELPSNRYPLGTCIKIVEGDNTYLLVATTRFNEYEHVDVSAEEFPEVVRKMFNGIEQLHDGEPVFIPLVGGGISGYELTNMQIIMTIVQAAHMAKRLCITKGIYLYLYGDKQNKSINLNIIKYLFQRWKTL